MVMTERINDDDDDDEDDDDADNECKHFGGEREERTHDAGLVWLRLMDGVLNE